MDQNVSIEEVLNNSFSTIYDVLKLVDSKVNDEVINSINNNADSDEIIRLQLFKEAYIKAIQETKNLQQNVVSLINYNEKSIDEIKSEVASMENVQDTEVFNEEVPVEEAIEDTSEIETENVEMPEEEVVEQDFSMPEINENPVENEEVVVEENTDNEEQMMSEETTEVEEQPIEENTEAEVSDFVSEITEESPVEDVPIEEETSTEEVSNEESNNQELVIPSVSDTPVEETPTEEENNGNEQVIPLAEDSSVEENITEEETPVEISFDGVNQEEQNIEQQEDVVLPVVEASDEDNNNIDSTKIYKTTNDSTRVILTTNVQYDNLVASKETNKALVSAKGILGDKEETINDDNVEEEAMKNGLVEESAESMQKQVEEFIAQAQSLYKEGKAQEAQELMNQVAVLNEKIKNLSNSGEEEKQFQLTA